MVLSLPISPETEARLKVKASAARVDVPIYVARIVEKTAMVPLSIQEINCGIADDFKKSGMTDDEFGELLEEVKHKMRAEQDAGLTPPQFLAIVDCD